MDFRRTKFFRKESERDREPNPEMNNKENIIETQPKIEIKCCKKHSLEDIKGFCEDCKSFFCKECFVDHIDHEIKSLKKFYKERKKNVVDNVSVWEFCTQLEKKREEIFEKKEKQYKDLDDINKKISWKETAIENNKEENLKK